MVIADNYFIENRILASAAILEAIPELRTLRQQIQTLRAECSGCQGKADKQKELDDKFNQLREFLANLHPDKKKVIQTKTGCDKIRVSYRVGAGSNTRIVSSFC